MPNAGSTSSAAHPKMIPSAWREGFAASGLSEDEIMAMFAEARDEIQQEKQNVG